MAKVNTIGIAGMALSLVCAGTFWLSAFLYGAVVGSGTSSFELEMKELMTVLAAVYIMGAALGGLSQIGGLMQMPSMVIGLPLAWYLDYHLVLYVFYVVGLLGTCMLITAMFVERSRPDRGFKAPPFSRVRIWQPTMKAGTARPFSKGETKRFLAALVVVPVLLAAFATYAWNAEVTTLRVSVLVNGDLYGSANISIIVDGEVVDTSFVEYDPADTRGLYVITTCKVTAGTHRVEVDVWNGVQLTEGSVDIIEIERCLPFTSERTRLTVGYGDV